MKEIMKWELKNLLKFPILEIIIVFAVFQVGLIWIMINSFSVGTYENMLTIPSFHSQIGQFAYRIITNNFVNSRTIIYFLASLLLTVSFAYELDTNLTKIYMSYPVKRRDYFVSKFVSCFAVIFLAFLFVGIGFAIFLDPAYADVTILSPFILAYALTLALLIFFASSVATIIAIFSKNTALSFIGSFFVLYMFDSSAAKMKIAPPSFLQEIWQTFFTGTTSVRNGEIIYHMPYVDALKTIYFPVIISLVLFLISFIYYTKYFEVK